MKIERHGWRCYGCSKEGVTVTSQNTDYEDFVDIVFRDHDLISATCRSSTLEVSANLQWEYGWNIVRKVGN